MGSVSNVQTQITALVMVQTEVYVYEPNETSNNINL